jgi:hypothetical protein
MGHAVAPGYDFASSPCKILIVDKASDLLASEIILSTLRRAAARQTQAAFSRNQTRVGPLPLMSTMLGPAKR